MHRRKRESLLKIPGCHNCTVVKERNPARFVLAPRASSLKSRLPCRNLVASQHVTTEKGTKAAHCESTASKDRVDQRSRSPSRKRPWRVRSLRASATWRWLPPWRRPPSSGGSSGPRPGLERRSKVIRDACYGWRRNKRAGLSPRDPFLCPLPSRGNLWLPRPVWFPRNWYIRRTLCHACV